MGVLNDIWMLNVSYAFSFKFMEACLAHVFSGQIWFERDETEPCNESNFEVLSCSPDMTILRYE